MFNKKLEQAERDHNLMYKDTITYKVRLLTAVLVIVSLCFIYLTYLTFSSYIENHQLKTEYHPIVKVSIPIEVPPASTQGNHDVSSEHHDYPEKTFPYPTVGIPVPGRTFNFTKVQKEDFFEFDTKLLEYFQPYNDTDCEYKRYGEANEGGYLVCRNFLKYSEALINLGIEARDMFGCDLTTDVPMPNYQYDCTSDKARACLTNNGADSFYKICMGERTERTQSFTFYTFEDMIRSHNLTRKHFTLKIDIEGGEFQAFKYFPVEDLDYIDQIIMELHLGRISREQWGFLDIFKTLSEHFAVVNFHMNNAGCNMDFDLDLRPFRKLPNNAWEIAMVNRRLIRINKDTRSFVEHPLNARNHPHVALCP